MADVETTKQLSSMRQTKAAGEYLHKGPLECAITLAAEGQLPETKTEYLFRLLQRLKPQENFNLFITWLKHPTGPDKATISEFEAVLVIARAIQKFVAVYEASCTEFNDFSSWAVAQGHLPLGNQRYAIQKCSLSLSVRPMATRAESS
ncbi:MAG: hypothetical protein ABI150_02900 [Nitrobacter sp.]